MSKNCVVGLSAKDRKINAQTETNEVCKKQWLYKQLLADLQVMLKKIIKWKSTSFL